MSSIYNAKAKIAKDKENMLNLLDGLGVNIENLKDIESKIEKQIKVNKECQKKWNERNKDKIKEYSKRYRESDKGKTFRKKYEASKKRKQYKKEYFKRPDVVEREKERLKKVYTKRKERYKQLSEEEKEQYKKKQNERKRILYKKKRAKMNNAEKEKVRKKWRDYYHKMKAKKLVLTQHSWNGFALSPVLFWFYCKKIIFLLILM